MDLAEHQDYEDAALDEGLVPLQPPLPVRSHTNVVRLDGNTPAASLPDEGAVPSQEDIPQCADMSPPATTPVPAPIRRARLATKVPISPGVSERRTRTLRATTQAARAARQLQDSLELTAFAANHFGLLQRDEEQVFNLTIAEASKDYGLKPVEDAIKSEISSLITDTGALEPCKTSGQQLPLHLILGHKFDAHGKYTKTKARIVIGGNLQHRDEDLNTSSFCVRVQSILLLLGVPHHQKLTAHAVDIKTAYLHATVDSKVYGRLPKKLVPFLLGLYPDMEKHLNRDGSMTFKVKKALYGLAEASRLWFLHLTSLLVEPGYTSSIHDRGVVYRFTPDGLVLILLRVDDMLVLTCDPKYWLELKTYFTANLRGITAQEGPTLSFVGLNINQQADHISINRRGYIEKLVSKRDPKDVTPAKTLYPLHLNALESLSDSVKLSEHALTPAIMEPRYLDDVRPDIKFATAFLTQHMSQPTVALERYVKQLLN